MHYLYINVLRVKTEDENTDKQKKTDTNIEISEILHIYEVKRKAKLRLFSPLRLDSL